jgi:integrase
MQDLMFYIKNIRSKHSKSRTHDFIFVAEQNSQQTSGLPITRELVNYMLKRVSASLGYDLHPHLLRHKWNERLSEMGLSKGVDRERLEDMRRNAMGWSPRSNMGDVYNTKYEQIRAIELMNKHQEKVDGKTS